MNRVNISFIIITSIVLISAAVAQQSKAPDYDALAQKLVNQCANIKEGQMVYIVGSERDLTLLENITVQVRKAGAFPLLSITNDRLEHRLYDDVPSKYDSQVDGMTKLMYNAVDAIIRIEASEKLDLLADIPVDRKVARSKAEATLGDILIKRNVRAVNLGNDLYPIAARAKQYHMNQAQLAEIFWAGVNTDYNKLQAIGRSLKELLVEAKDVQITSPSGTNLSVKITGQRPYVSDGIITDADLKEGYAGSNTYLPAGEIYVTPVPGTAQGKVIVDKFFFEGKEIKRLVLEFKDGKLMSMSAAIGLAPLKALYDAVSDAKDEFAFVDFGFNPDVVIPPGSSMDAWMVSGMVTVGIGNNIWAGGENKSRFSLSLHQLSGTVKLDGKILIDKGKLKLLEEKK